MSRKTQIKMVNEKRLYVRTRDGDDKPTYYWSVTSILGSAVPKFGLLPWAAKSAAECAVADHDMISGWIANNQSSMAVEHIKNAHVREKEYKASIGKAAHKYIRAIVLGKEMPPPPSDVVPFLRQFDRFVLDLKPDFQLAEANVFNYSLIYAGTLDTICEIPSLGRVLIDYKTGKGVYPDAALQLAAYKNAEFVGMEDGSEPELGEIDGTYVLHIRPDSYKLIPMDTGEDTFKHFRYFTAVMFGWIQEHSKTVMGDPIIPVESEAK